MAFNINYYKMIKIYSNINIYYNFSNFNKITMMQINLYQYQNKYNNNLNKNFDHRKMKLYK